MLVVDNDKLEKCKEFLVILTQQTIEAPTQDSVDLVLDRQAQVAVENKEGYNLKEYINNLFIL